MRYHDIEEIQKNLPKFLEEIGDSHEEIMITRDGVAIAMILPFKGAKPEVTAAHPLQGKPIWIADDFDAPQPELWEALSE
jgi:antitoxin (DNA-binding transcriptional repressor) of toxin-antitoxin stability system